MLTFVIKFLFFNANFENGSSWELMLPVMLSFPGVGGCRTGLNNLLFAPAQNRLHLLLGGVGLVLLQQLIPTAHAPLIRLRKTGTVGAASARAQGIPIFLASSVKMKWSHY